MSYIFVGGAQRSGTSLLAASLCAGEETNPYLGESSSLQRLLQTYTHMAGRFDDEMVFHFGTKAVMNEYFSTMLRSFLSHTLATHAPATSLVLKEPHMTTLFPAIHAMLPEAKFVIIVRDPRDIITSMMTVGEKLKQAGSNHLFNSNDVGKMAAQIGAFYRPSLVAMQNNKGFAQSTVWVKYEELVTSALPVMDKLRGFTGLKLELYDPDEPRKRTHPAKLKSREKSERAKPWQSELMGQKSMSDKSLGSFRDKLNEDQIKEIETTLPGFFNRFGYETVSG